MATGLSVRSRASHGTWGAQPLASPGRPLWGAIAAEHSGPPGLPPCPPPRAHLQACCALGTVQAQPPNHRLHRDAGLAPVQTVLCAKGCSLAWTVGGWPATSQGRGAPHQERLELSPTDPITRECTAPGRHGGPLRGHEQQCTYQEGLLLFAIKVLQSFERHCDAGSREMKVNVKEHHLISQDDGFPLL